MITQIRWDLACQSRADEGESAGPSPRQDKQTMEGTKGSGLETTSQVHLHTMLLIQDKGTDEGLGSRAGTTYEAATSDVIHTRCETTNNSCDDIATDTKTKTARMLYGNYSSRRTCHMDSSTCDPKAASPKTLRRLQAACIMRRGP